MQYFLPHHHYERMEYEVYETKIAGIERMAMICGQCHWEEPWLHNGIEATIVEFKQAEEEEIKAEEVKKPKVKKIF